MGHCQRGPLTFRDTHHSGEKVHQAVNVTASDPVLFKEQNCATIVHQLTQLLAGRPKANYTDGLPNVGAVLFPEIASLKLITCSVSDLF